MSEDRENEELGWVADDTAVLIRDEVSNDGANAEPNFGTVDEIFEKIGPCGRYQYIRGFILCILNIPMTYQILIMYFTGHSPNWRCVNGTDAACNMTGEISPADVDQFNSRCHMPRQSWEYVTPRHFSVITEVWVLFALILVTNLTLDRRNCPELLCLFERSRFDRNIKQSKVPTGFFSFHLCIYHYLIIMN